MDRDELQEHMISTYTYLRLGLGGIALILPLFLWFVGLGWYGIPLQGSLSAYYFASPEQALVPEPVRTELASPHDVNLDAFLFFLSQTDAVTPMRSWFVGALFVVGAFLIFYKGFTVPEDVSLNIAGFSALGVAIFPMAHG
jgi:hypothetical protein